MKAEALKAKRKNNPAWAEWRNEQDREYRKRNREAGKEYRAAYFQTPKGKYSLHRNNAIRVRGLEWGFTFETWWAVWEKSGKWHLRGNRPEQYCMCRRDDVGPYSPDNVYIDTMENNRKHATINGAQRNARRVGFYGYIS
jgi:hypothetical protein